MRDLAAQGYRYTLTGRQRFRGDFVVCGLEGGGSGAAHLVRPYRDENGIYKSLAVDAGEVPHAISSADGSVRAVLVLEDFIGTGGTARQEVRKLFARWTAEGAWLADIDIYLLALCGFDDAIAKVREVVAGEGMPIHIHVAVPLDDEDRCFSDRSRIFAIPEERDQARALCFDKGSSLDRKYPLGYQDSQAAVCFEMRCPNNCPPVLWKDGPTWLPLFPRMAGLKG